MSTEDKLYNHFAELFLPRYREVDLECSNCKSPKLIHRYQIGFGPWNGSTECPSCGDKRSLVASIGSAMVKVTPMDE